ncbi:MAG: efflux RND transporter periplasmic adaptor subunit [Pseudomonadota bacterium]
MFKGILILVVLSLAAFAGWEVYGSEDIQAAKKEAVRLVTIAVGDISEEVTAQGRLEAKEYVDVGTQVSGQLEKIHVGIGNEVKTGDLLVEIDPRIYETRVAAGKAHLNTLAAQMTEQKAQLALARRQHGRNINLIKSNAVSRDALDQSEAALKAGQAKVAALKAEIDESGSTLDADAANLAYTKIKAPMTGTVVAMPLREGQTVNASQTAPTILRISNLDVMTVRAQVAEADVMRLKEGMTVSFATLGQMEQRWPGTVRQILPTPEIVSDVVLYDVLIDAGNKDRQLMSGMSTQVFFTIGSVQGVPLIPVEALIRRKTSADSDKGMAYVVSIAGDEGGRPEDRVIHVGLMDRTQAEVRDGIKAGERIILPSQPSSGSSKTGDGFRGMPHL